MRLCVQLREQRIFRSSKEFARTTLIQLRMKEFDLNDGHIRTMKHINEKILLALSESRMNFVDEITSKNSSVLTRIDSY